MPMRILKSAKSRYFIFLLWLTVVSAGLFLLLYMVVSPSLLFSLVDQLLIEFDLPVLDLDILPKVIVSTVLSLLLWWRIVKVIVFQGSPFSFGMGMIERTAGRGSTTRPVRIFSYRDQRNIWYLAVFQAHQVSDKLVRSRLHLLMLGLTSKTAFVVRQSRWSLERLDHEQRDAMSKNIGLKYPVL